MQKKITACTDLSKINEEEDTKKIQGVTEKLRSREEGGRKKKVWMATKDSGKKQNATPLM